MRAESDDVSIRLTPNQVSLIWSGLNEVVKSHSAWLSKKVPAFSYPFRLLPPPPEFDGGTFSLQFMELVLGWKRLRSKVNCGGRLRMNTIEIRAAILGARINMDWSRFKQKAASKYSKRAKGSKEPDDASLKRLEGANRLRDPKPRAPHEARELPVPNAHFWCSVRGIYGAMACSCSLDAVAFRLFQTAA